MDNEMNATIRALLNQCKTILDIRSRKREQPGENFNIFSVLNVEDKEVDTHSRFLYELLCPDGSHGLGDEPLRAFFQLVLDQHYPADGVVRVLRERMAIVDGQKLGRMDLLIEGADFCYPIEVKIHAEDQDRQMERYDQFAPLWKKGGECQVYYLTLDGHEPSAKSLGSMKAEEVKCISFGVDIQHWLERCGELAWQSPALVDIILQYRKLLEKLTGFRQGDEYMELIQNAIKGSRADYEAAEAIASALTAVRIEMMQKVFNRIVQHIGGRLKEERTTYQDDAIKYYTSRNSLYPCATFLLQVCGELTLALQIEVDWKLYTCLVYYKTPNETDRNKGKFQKAADLYPQLAVASGKKEWADKIRDYKPCCYRDYSLEWRYLPEATPIDFHEFNDTYRALYDPAGFDAMMEQILSELDEYIQELRDRGLIKNGEANDGTY